MKMIIQKYQHLYYGTVKIENICECKKMYYGNTKEFKH